MLPTDVHSRDRPSKVCFKTTHNDITTSEKLIVVKRVLWFRESRAEWIGSINKRHLTIQEEEGLFLGKGPRSIWLACKYWYKTKMQTVHAEQFCRFGVFV